MDETRNTAWNRLKVLSATFVATTISWNQILSAGRATTGFAVAGVCTATKLDKVKKLVVVERGGTRSTADSAARKINSNITSENDLPVDKPFPATAQDRESMSCLGLRREESSNNSNQ